MALDKDGLKATFKSIFSDVTQGKTPETVAEQMADAIDTYVKTAIAKVVIPQGTVVIAAAPIAAPVLNPAPIPLTGEPTGTPPGGLS